MSVEEYQIGQLYTIQKKSRIESTGAGSGVEILENKPYESNDERGQYTLKVFHVDERLPAGLKTVSKLLFPKSALLFEEESWNCYPHTRTKYSHKLFKSFNIDIESKYLSDCGQNENVFNLNRSELATRSVDFIDIVTDPINAHEYKLDEDPAKFHSTKTKRGPLAPNWAKELRLNAQPDENVSLLNCNSSSGIGVRTRYMCAYKLCRIECAFWGCQSRVEKLISESVLRNMILMSHRQAWCWQDEYVELTMDDVRELERETQLYLIQKMNNNNNNYSHQELVHSKSSLNRTPDMAATIAITAKANQNQNQPQEQIKASQIVELKTQNDIKENDEKEELDRLANENNDNVVVNSDKQVVKLSQLKSKSLSHESENYEDFPYNDFFVDSTNDLLNLSNLNNNATTGNNVNMQKDNSNFDEFYDAISQASVCFSTNDDSETYSINSLNYNNNNNSSEMKLKQQNSCSSAPPLFKNVDLFTQTSLDLSSCSIKNSQTGAGGAKKQISFDLASSTLFDNNKQQPVNSCKLADTIAITTTTTNQATSKSPATTSASRPRKSQQSLTESSCIDTLVLVVHGGNVTCTDTSKASDFANFKSTMELMIKSSYSNLYGRIAYRLVKCDQMCKDALIKLSALSPVNTQHNEQQNRTFSMNDSSDEFGENSSAAAIFSLHENLPFNTLPLLAMANPTQYRASLAKFVRESNRIYHEFLASNEGKFFQGQVVLIGDSLGSLFAYDSLCQVHLSTSNDNKNMNSNKESSASETDAVSGSVSASVSGSASGSVSGDRFLHQSSSQSSFVLNMQSCSTKSSINSDPRSNQSRLNNNSVANKENKNPLISISDLSTSSTNLTKTANMTETEPKITVMTSSSSSQNSSSNNANPNNNNNNHAILEHSSSGSSYLLMPQSPNHSFKLNNNGPLVTDEKLDFDVTHFFVFGSPLGLILTARKLAKTNIDMPCCSQMYNLFHLTDPVAVRVEPLLCKQFALIEPCTIPRFSKFPLGDGSNLSLDHFIVKHNHLFEQNNTNTGSLSPVTPTTSEISNLYLTPNFEQLRQLQKMMQTKKQWWGENRIDYVLYAPETIVNLPRKSLPYIFHSCFWESTDVVAFILRMLSKSDSLFGMGGVNGGLVGDEMRLMCKNYAEPVEKWQRRLNRVKLRNLSANHRANDVIVLEDKEQILNAKFSYGALDFALSGEKVDIYLITKASNTANANNNGDDLCRHFLATEATDSHGRIKYKLAKEKRQPLGIYQIRMVVKCDHTVCEFFMAVLPVNTECIVFSIDGSFAANISLSGNDPKVRAGAVDVVRHWHDLGYLILYVTARPDIQHYKVTNWLAQHNFPLGMVFFSDGISTDPIKQKTEILKSLTQSSCLRLQAAYGSAKDIPMYSSLGVSSNKIFIMGKMKTKFHNQAVELKEGYALHLANLQNPNTGSRQASGNARLFLKKDSFSIRQNTMFAAAPVNPSEIATTTSSTNTNANNNYKAINESNTVSVDPHSNSNNNGPKKQLQQSSISVDFTSESLISTSSVKETNSNQTSLVVQQSSLLMEKDSLTPTTTNTTQVSTNFLKQGLNKLQQSSSELILNKSRKSK